MDAAPQQDGEEHQRDQRRRARARLLDQLQHEEDEEGQQEVRRPHRVADGQVRDQVPVEEEHQRQQREGQQPEPVAPAQQQQAAEAERVQEERVHHQERGRRQPAQEEHLGRAVQLGDGQQLAPGQDGPRHVERQAVLLHGLLQHPRVAELLGPVLHRRRRTTQQPPVRGEQRGPGRRAAHEEREQHRALQGLHGPASSAGALSPPSRPLSARKASRAWASTRWPAWLGWMCSRNSFSLPGQAASVSSGTST